ncbi:hypothetical protein EC957_010602 [Mortierella hygrophila]|uniref:Uncharacterized protein n=1 Tax=Mortierella hygrophila TaxID=979708 RepID=A0A9P6EW21_9FUNG|nr:hypothetical protein EC957_010602 [Mortierella hygrophila]
MYKDPFRLIRLKHARTAPPKLSKLIRVLLRSMPDDPVSALLRAAYLSESSEPGHQQTAEATTTTIPYYWFVTSVGFKPSYSLPFTIFLGVDAGFRDYLKRYGYTSRYLLECSVKDDLAYKSYDWIAQYAAGQELCRDLTWALSMDAERVKALSVPLSDIARYLPLASRFEVLADVTFLLDRNTRPAGDWQQSATLEQQEAWKLLQMERLQLLEAMISFTQEHRRRHPGVLATGRLKLKESDCKEDGPEEYQLRLLKSLPPLNNPRYLDSDNWAHFVVQAKDTDLSFVRTFVPPSRSRLSYGGFVPEPFLHRCRTLEYIRMDFPGDDDTFQWAVDERKKHIIYTTAGRQPRQPLVPLRHFDGNHGPLCTGRHVNDVAFAFCDTIETIDISGTWPGSDEFSQEPPEIPMYYNESFWLLPLLSIFKVHINCINLRLEPDIVSRCPQLVTMSLGDHREEYVMDEIEYWKPAELPRLTTLDLRGTPAISFHPDTLKTTPSLQSLNLKIWRGTRINSFIPPPKDFVCMDMSEPSDTAPSEIFSTYATIRRPVWTWDWDLPKLTELRLEAEHAYRFQFRMLGGTPSLVELSINCRSLSGLHRRTIGLEDLLKSSPVSPPSAQILDGSGGVPTQETQESMYVDTASTSWQKSEYVHVPALRIFNLEGTWALGSPAVLEVLCSKVLPNVSRLSMNDGCGGFSLAEWVGLTSSHLHLLRHATIRRATTWDELCEVGLEHKFMVPSSIPKYTLAKRPKGRILEENAVYEIKGFVLSRLSD